MGGGNRPCGQRGKWWLWNGWGSGTSGLCCGTLQQDEGQIGELGLKGLDLRLEEDDLGTQGSEFFGNQSRGSRSLLSRGWCKIGGIRQATILQASEV
jgi:hypothetical protein